MDVAEYHEIGQWKTYIIVDGKTNSDQKSTSHISEWAILWSLQPIVHEPWRYR